VNVAMDIGTLVKTHLMIDCILKILDVEITYL
jgi:hypothetical protein